MKLLFLVQIAYIFLLVSVAPSRYGLCNRAVNVSTRRMVLHHIPERVVTRLAASPRHVPLHFRRRRWLPACPLRYHFRVILIPSKFPTYQGSQWSNRKLSWQIYIDIYETIKCIADIAKSCHVLVFVDDLNVSKCKFQI